MKSIKLLTTVGAFCGLYGCVYYNTKFFEGFISEDSINTVTV